MPVIDIDILDAEAVQVVLGIIEPGQRLLYRTGRAPKVAIPFKCFEPFKKKIHRFRAPDGAEHKIEVLGWHNQMASFGIHPDTHQPFTWSPASPLDVDWTDLPELTADVATSFLLTCNARLEKHGWKALTEERPPPRPYAGPRTVRSTSKRLTGVLGKMAAATNGERQMVAHWGACRLREMVQESMLSADEAIQLAIEAGMRSGLPHWRINEVATRIIK
jgi:hypothetical protein